MARTTASRVGPGRARLGEILVEAGVLSPERLEAALEEQRRWGDRLGRTLVFMGFLTEEGLAAALAHQLRLPLARPDVERLPEGVTRYLGVHDCERYGVMPLRVERGALLLATADPTNAPALDELADLAGLRIERAVATESAIARAIRRYYYGDELPPAPDAVDAGPGDAPLSGEAAATPVSVEIPLSGPPDAEASDPSTLEIDVEVTGEKDLSPAALLAAVDRLERDLAREVRVLRALVESLIDRGIITREEYLARLRAREE